jgi:hypothetical protein
MKNILCALGFASAVLLSSCATTKTEDCCKAGGSCDMKDSKKCDMKKTDKPAAGHDHEHATKKKAS